MIDRVRRAEPDRSELEDSLKIDDDALDDCLVEQPGFFYHVAEAVAAANARRDTLKLKLEETLAELDQNIRSEALRTEEKITEASIQNRLRTFPRIQDLQRDYLDARTDAEKWTALKEAYQQRSFMLRELVALQLAQAHNLGIERGAVSARHELGDRARQRAEDLRRERRQTR
jgi:uncharacterized protein YigA (DUF484 family)